MRVRILLKYLETNKNANTVIIHLYFQINLKERLLQSPHNKNEKKKNAFFLISIMANLNN